MIVGGTEEPLGAVSLVADGGLPAVRERVGVATVAKCRIDRGDAVSEPPVSPTMSDR